MTIQTHLLSLNLRPDHIVISGVLRTCSIMTMIMYVAYRFSLYFIPYLHHAYLDSLFILISNLCTWGPVTYKCIPFLS